MGNCVQSSSGGGSGACHGTGGEGGRLGQMQRRRNEEEVAVEDQGKAPAPPSVVKVKMVLTKGELGWLVARLKAGDRRLEDVLHEMARKKREGRAGGGDGWRSSLESIVECPAETVAASSDPTVD